jgi:hypothetical protein
MPEAISTSLIDTSADFLPGLVPEDMPAPLTEEEYNALPIYTAAQLFKQDERRYKLAVALFFGVGAGFRQTCNICKVGQHTLQAIIRNEVGSKTAEQWRAAASGELRALTQLALSASSQLLADPKAIESAGIKGLATILRELTHAHELINQRLPGQVDAAKLTPEQQAELYIKSQASARGQSIEVVESGEATRGAKVLDQDGSEVSDD